MYKKVLLFFVACFALITGARCQTFIKKLNSASSFTPAGSTVLFFGDNTGAGQVLWKTDGTTAGTVMIKNIRPGSIPTGDAPIFIYNGKAYFSGYDGINGAQVWQSDGTSAGTVMLKNTGVNPTGNGGLPRLFRVCNGGLYFVQTSDGITYSLWKSDGTANGTAQITPNDQTTISALTVVGNTLYFTKENAGLWQSDGTSAGTKQIQVDANQIIGLLTSVNNYLVFVTDENYYLQNVNLYALSPSTGTPVLLQTFNPGGYSTSTIDNLTAVGSNFYFSIRTDNNISNAASTDVLWTSDGTPAGTVQVASYNWQQGLAYDYMRNFISFNNKLYFAANSSGALSTSDGTTGGTTAVSTASVDQGIAPVISNGKIFFSSSSTLWSYDGANAKPAFRQPTGPVSMADDNGRLYFTVQPSYGNFQLWDNVPAGQLQVTMGYQNLFNGGTTAITSKSDSLVTNQVNVTNNGNNTLVFSEIGISGDSFYVNGTPAQTLPPGGQASFNLLYSPLKDEKTSAVLDIKSNDNSGGTEFFYNFNGTASGAAGQTTKPAAGGLEKEIVFADSNSTFALSNNTIAENASVNSIIGTFQVANASGYQYQLVTGVGSADNTSFVIVNGTLQSASVFNFANRNTYSVRVQASNGTTSFQKIFVIQVTSQQTNLAPPCGESFQDLTYSLNDATYNGSRIVAVGTSGVILNSDDKGQSWKKINSGVSYEFDKVQFTSIKIGYILGQTAPMFKTEDGGNTWFPLAWPSTAPTGLTSMFFVSDTLGYVIGSNAIFKTTDGGRTWTQQSFSASGSTLYSIWFIDANNGFACGSSETLLHTTNGGNTWQTVALSVLGSGTPLNNVTFTNNLTGYITSTEGDVLQTTDGGNTWARISTVSNGGGLARIYFKDLNNGYILANSGGLYVTADGGHTWNLETLPPGGAFTGLAIHSAGANYCLVGHVEGPGSTFPQGSVIFTSGDAVTWTNHDYFGNDNYRAGNLFSNGTGYLFGDQNLKTTDGGTTWKQLNISAPYGDLIMTGVFLNADMGFYADDYNIYKSTDGGNSWVLKNRDTVTPVATPIVFYNNTLGFYSNGETLYRTTDGGDTWKSVLVPTSYNLRNICFADQTTIYTTGIGMPLYRSADGGNTWSSSNFDPNAIILSLYFFDALNGLAGGTSGLLLRTADGGQTWTPLSTQMQLDIMGFQFVDKLHGYALTKYDGGSGGIQIFETTDGGNTWNEIYQPPNNILGFQLNDGQLFLSGASGTIIKLNSISPPPVNAGYIVGDTVVASGVKITYAVPAVQNSYYKWIATGAESVEYHNNQVIVSWQNGGKFALQVTPYSACSNGQSRAITVDVEDMPAPQVTGPDSVANYAANILYTTPASTNTFTWTAIGDVSVSPAANEATVNWGKSGNGSITVVETNSALDLQKSAVLNVVINQGTVTLPDSNFTVSVTSASCIGSANGSIRVKAQDPLNYTAAVTGPGSFSKNLTFTDSLTISNLDTGRYSVCIGISGNNTFQRCYTLNVTEPKPLSTYAVVNQNTRTVTLDLAGANTYYVNLNGKVYQTSANQLNLPLNNGRNQLEIYTDKPCQGEIQKVLDLNLITVYPVPFANVLNIDLGGSTEPAATVSIADAFGRTVYNKELVNNNGKLLVDVSNFMIGTYVLKLTLGTSSTIFKVLKQ